MNIIEDLSKLINDYHSNEIDSLKDMYLEILDLRENYKKQFSLNSVGCSLPSKIEVNFDGNLLAEIETTDKNLKVLNAVNGWGEPVDVAKIQIVKK